ncbi:hypothetical protein V6N12_059632 [Hibiscus sabdariffa]|uniref:Uncharacterized protein n=1 Tax=Hibiscus sabdariffa TaxID=183260 RepID=A0ABR2EVM2_9ROSI
MCPVVHFACPLPQPMRALHDKSPHRFSIAQALPIFQRARGTTRKRIEHSNKARDNDSWSGEQDEEEDGCCGDDGDGDEKVEVKRKMVALQRIVPGGEDLGADQLFEETAGYILALQCQIRTMKALASFIEGVDKEKRKLGG